MNRQRLKPTSLQLRRGDAAQQASQIYDQNARATETGQKSAELRKRAVQLSDSGNHDQAHELFVKAVGFFASDDDSAAASAACFDLAVSYKSLKSGVRQENLRVPSASLHESPVRPM